jgi:hypothetical protein
MGAESVSINGVSYSFFTNSREWSSIGSNSVVIVPDYLGPYNQTSNGSISATAAAGILFGTKTTSGGSLIDWNAPNAEIERQIKELHETWDVSEHEGAVTANGTYVLAGPIEYNPGD